MGCGFSCLFRSRNYHEDIHLDRLEPFLKHPEDMDDNVPKDEDRQTWEDEDLAASASGLEPADTSAAQRRRANGSRPISVSSVNSLNSVIYFL